MSILRRAAGTAGRTALITTVATKSHQRVAAKQQPPWNQQTAAPAQAPSPAPVAAAPAPRDTQAMIDQLRQLGELRDAGVLTEPEFEVKKAQVLHG